MTSATDTITDDRKIVVTERAATEFMHIVAQKALPEGTGMRLSVKGGGCSGFSYVLDLTETQREDDEIWESEYELAPPPAAGAGDESGTAVAERFVVRVVCDPKSYLYLNGTSIDFKEEIMGRGFVFNNPNATSTCGCGSSFSA